MKSGFSHKLFILAAALLTISTSQARNVAPSSVTPFESSGNGPTHYIDFANFQGVDNKTYTEFYFQVSYNDLQFYKNGDHFEAGYALEFKVMDSDGNLLEHHETSDLFEVESYAQTLSTQKARVMLLGFTFEAGEYAIQSKMTDLETRETATIERTLRIGAFATDDLTVSDLQLSQNISPAEPGQPYVKNQRYIEPNAVRTFAHGLADIYVYFEVYNLMENEAETPGKYEAYFIIKDESGQLFARLKRDHDKPGNTSAHSIKLPIEYFKNGHYSLTVQIVDRDSGETTESTKDFTVLSRPFSAADFENEEPNRP